MTARSTFLSHVLWLGGPPDAGKTSVANQLAEWHGLQVYHFDRHEPAHMARADATSKPALWAARPENMKPQQRWLGSSHSEMAHQAIESWSERFEFACEDLLAMPQSPPIIAEGPGFFPDLVLMVIDDPAQAAYLVPTEDFRDTSLRRRNKPGDRDQTTDPVQAIDNLLARDSYIAAHVRDRAEALGLTLIDVDGTRTIEEIASQLEEQWSPWLH
jgi:hypothetical protein